MKTQYYTACCLDGYIADEHGHLLDFHACTFDEYGNNIFGVDYPLASWQEHGSINGTPVRCIPPKWMVSFHTGNPLDENDYHDVKLLCEKFNLSIPKEYDQFVKKDEQ